VVGPDDLATTSAHHGAGSVVELRPLHSLAPMQRSTGIRFLHMGGDSARLVGCAGDCAGAETTGSPEDSSILSCVPGRE
jgi:hypothetical protein